MRTRNILRAALRISIDDGDTATRAVRRLRFEYDARRDMDSAVRDEVITRASMSRS